jgi:hypothetical protein
LAGPPKHKRFFRRSLWRVDPPTKHFLGRLFRAADIFRAPVLAGPPKHKHFFGRLLWRVSPLTAAFRALALAGRPSHQVLLKALFPSDLLTGLELTRACVLDEDLYYAAFGFQQPVIAN